MGREGIEPPMPKQSVYSAREPPGSSDPRERLATVLDRSTKIWVAKLGVAHHPRYARVSSPSRGTSVIAGTQGVEPCPHSLWRRVGQPLPDPYRPSSYPQGSRPASFLRSGQSGYPHAGHTRGSRRSSTVTPSASANALTTNADGSRSPASTWLRNGREIPALAARSV